MSFGFWDGSNADASHGWVWPLAGIVAVGAVTVYVGRELASQLNGSQAASVAASWGYLVAVPTVIVGAPIGWFVLAAFLDWLDEKRHPPAKVLDERYTVYGRFNWETAFLMSKGDKYMLRDKFAAFWEGVEG